MGTKSSKSLLDKNELKNLVKRTGYTEETIESWYKLFTKCSDNKRDFLKSRYDECYSSFDDSEGSFFSDLDTICSRFHTGLSDDCTGGLLGYLTGDSSDESQASSVVRFREFLTLQHLSAHGSEEEKLRRIFRCCDPGDRGRITRADLARVLTTWAQRDMGHSQIVQRLDKYTSYTEEQFLAICSESETKKFNNNNL